MRALLRALALAAPLLLLAGCESGEEADLKHCMKTAKSHNSLTDTQAREYCNALGVY